MRERIVSLPYFKLHVHEEVTTDDDLLGYHISIGPMFEHDHEATGKIYEGILEAFKNLKQFDVVTGETVRLGEHGEYVARRVEKTEVLAEVHAAAIKLVEEHDPVVLEKKPWHGERYNPHVSTAAGVELEEGRAYRVTHIGVAQASAGERRMSRVAEYPLGETA